jgi:hypothetical protein
MNSENLVAPQKYTFMDSIKTGAILGLAASLIVLFAVYFVAKILLA